ncbi:hypothetical protein Hanom_Chr13g01207351 [Helianthus anomalus]
MSKISSESSSSSSNFVEKQAVGIHRGDKSTDRGLKSILTPTKPVEDKKTEEAEKPKQKEQVQKEAGGVKEEKAKAPAATMKTESTKEKNDMDLVNNIPYEFKVKLCSESCVNVVAHYKSLNLELIRDKERVLQFNKELKENEAAYHRKLNSTLAKMQTLKEFVFRKDFIINDLTERLEKSLNENNKLQIIIDKLNANKKALVDIKNCQRPTCVKDGIDYKDKLGNERKLFFPLHSKNYVPTPTPHPDNDLIDEKDLIAQINSFENETTTNISESNACVYM